MQPRSDIIDQFIQGTNWAGARRAPLAGDASFRKYERLFLDGQQAVLMNAPPDKEDVRPFMRIAAQLRASGMSAPGIIASDEKNGLLILEDLGDDLYARVLQKQAGQEQELYLAAADVLAGLHHHARTSDYDNIPAFDMKRMLAQVSVFGEWFLPLVVGKEQAQHMLEGYLVRWENVLSQLPDLGRVLVLYDYHAENLLWLPGRKGAARVGLLDFQDAMLGSPAYDMVSYLEDARRDVMPETVSAVIERYIDKTGLDKTQFMHAYALLGAQRNCRILGTFVRLALRDGKRSYLSFMPRVWRHMEHDMAHLSLGPVRQWMDEHILPHWRGALTEEKLEMKAAV